MPGRWATAILCGLVSLAMAVFYRALRSASPARIEEINRQKKLYRSLPDFDSALLAAGWLKVIVYAAYAASVAFLFFGTWQGFFTSFLAAVAVSGATLLGGEALALVAAGYHSGQVFYSFIPAVTALAAAGAAVTYAGGALAGIVAKVSGWEPPLEPREAAEEEILDAIVEGRHKGVLATQESEMMESIIEFQDAQVSQITTPRTNVTSVLAGSTLPEALEAAISSGHSRLPVKEASADNIIGVFHVKDIWKLVRTRDFAAMTVRDVMRPPYFVPETKRVRELLKEFRVTRVHIAVVLDEYGGTAGIVTIEDVLTRIVGPIGAGADGLETDEIRVIGPGSAIVQGKARVGDVNEAASTSIPLGEDYETAAGYVLSETGRIPSAGETIELGALVFRILDADERRIKRMSVEAVQRRQDAAVKAR